MAVLPSMQAPSPSHGFRKRLEAILDVIVSSRESFHVDRTWPHALGKRIRQMTERYSVRHVVTISCVRALIFTMLLFMLAWYTSNRSWISNPDMNVDGMEGRDRLPEPDFEQGVVQFRVPTMEQEIGPPGLTTCIVTSLGRNTSAEVVANVAKSWFLAYTGQPPLLHVLMFGNGPTAATWASRLKSLVGSASWMRVSTLSVSRRVPRRTVPGQAAALVQRRAAAAEDYASALRTCARTSPGAQEFLIVRDDVLFSRRVPAAAHWASWVLQDDLRMRRGADGGWVRARACAASLFSADRHSRRSGGVHFPVASVWRSADASFLAEFIEKRYDLASVDTLVDMWCHKMGAIVEDLRPSAVSRRKQGRSGRKDGQNLSSEDDAADGIWVHS